MEKTPPPAGTGSTSTSPPRRSPIQTLFLIFILGVAFVIRAAGVTWGQAYNYGSQGDSVEAYEVAVGYLAGERRAEYLGQPNYNSETGAKLPGPGWTLFCVLGLTAWGSMEGVSWLLVLANVAAIFFLCRLAEKTVGPKAALAAALLVATAPSVIAYSFAVHNPAAMPLLSTLFYLALWRVVRVDRSRAVFWVCFLLFLMAQFHLSGLLLIPAAAVMTWIARRPVNVAWLLLGCLVGLAIYLPYIIGDRENGWQNSRAILGSPSNRYVADTLKVFVSPAALFVNYWYPQGAYTPEEFRDMCRFTLGGLGWVLASNILSTVVAVVLVTQVVVQVRRATKGFWKSPRTAYARSPGIVFLVVLLVVPLAFALATGVPFHARYSLILIGPLYALVGSSAVALLSGRFYPRTLLILGITVISINIWFMLSTNWFLGQHIDHAPHFHGSFRQLERVYQALRAFAGEDRAIEVNESLYSPSPVDEEHHFRDALRIRLYVAAREKLRDLGGVSAGRERLVFDLLPASEQDAGEREVVFTTNGIELTIPRR